MIRETRKCRRGHSYVVCKPKTYTGKAEYPASCPDCSRMR